MVDGKPAEGEFLMADGSTIKIERNCNSNFSNEVVEPVVDAEPVALK
jgi:hypothetical protein